MLITLELLKLLKGPDLKESRASWNKENVWRDHQSQNI